MTENAERTGTTNGARRRESTIDLVRCPNGVESDDVPVAAKGGGQGIPTGTINALSADPRAYDRYAAGPLKLRIDWNDARPVVTVEGMPPPEQLAMPEGAAGEGDRGLHMVKTLAQHIAFESDAEGGTRLTVRIPIARRVG